MYRIVGENAIQEFAVRPLEYICCYSDNSFSISKHDDNLLETNNALVVQNACGYFFEQNQEQISKKYVVKSNISNTYVNVSNYNFVTKAKDDFYNVGNSSFVEIAPLLNIYNLSAENVMSQVILVHSLNVVGTNFYLPSFSDPAFGINRNQFLARKNYGLKFRIINNRGNSIVTISSSLDGTNILVGNGNISDIMAVPYVNNTATFVSFLHSDNSYKTYRVS